tara:strand:- start:40 stop:687 length:648 start_codon:yes stop_codon:yes gene_type:complete
MSNYYKCRVGGKLDNEAGYCEMSVENYDRLYERCNNNKSKTCNAMVTEEVALGWDLGWVKLKTKRKVYLDKSLFCSRDYLSINCRKDEVDEDDGNWKMYYIILHRGLYQCEKCCVRFDLALCWEVDNEIIVVCKDCRYEHLIKEWKNGIELRCKKDAVKIISNRFLEIKYNPEYKYCRDRLENLYNSEYDENYVEGEKIYKGNYKDIYVKYSQHL